MFSLHAFSFDIRRPQIKRSWSACYGVFTAASFLMPSVTLVPAAQVPVVSIGRCCESHQPSVVQQRAKFAAHRLAEVGRVLRLGIEAAGGNSAMLKEQRRFERLASPLRHLTTDIV